MTPREGISDRALAIAAKVEAFVRETIASYETDRRRDHHGAPTDELVMEMRERARAAGVLTPHILDDGSHLNQNVRSEHRSEEHTSELQSLMRISYAVFCLKKKNHQQIIHVQLHHQQTLVLVKKQ